MVKWCSEVHVLLVLGVDCTARGTVKSKFTRVQFMFSCYTCLVSQSLTRRQANAVEVASKVCFSLFDIDLPQRY